MTTRAPSTAERVKKHRDALRAAGLRPVQIWVPDTRQPGFAAECRRQSRIVARKEAESASQQWLEQVADTDGWR
ncbi:MAG: hypothetical protein JWQ13_3440 [Ramlibacter sp.]|jgi:hypothetical protein|nr:hypothetical protein [Ramlibacter sp.]